MAQRRTAFVLGGGGLLGAGEVGMLRALLENGVFPDMVVGTSVGAINGAAVAADPTLSAIDKLAAVWHGLANSGLYRASPVRRARHVARARTSVHPNDPLRDLLLNHLGDRRIEDLPVPFQCVAASIERAAEHWFTTGRVVDAVVASAAVPGLLPPAKVGDEHYLDGGIVNSIPLGRAVTLGAKRVFVLQVGRIDRPLSPPKRPWDVARVSFEIARRHRFNRELAELPEGVEAHVLPARGTSSRDDTFFGTRDFAGVQQRIDETYEATRAYLEEHL